MPIFPLRTLWLFAFAFAATAGLRADPELGFATPPQQAAPWSLPEEMDDPDGIIKTTVNTLFELGLADPRGCSYRHVTIKEGGVQVEARGWVLPESKNVIGWNGLIYPVEGVGAEANLAADIEILKRNGEFAEAPSSNYQDESLERILKQFAATPRMMRACAAPYLLLRLGFVIGTAEVPDNPFAETPFDFGKGRKLTFPKDWYFDSHGRWLVEFGCLVRGDGVAAFVDHKDRLAAARLLLFDRVLSEIEKRCVVTNEREDDPFAEEDTQIRPRLNPVWRSILADAKRRIEPHATINQSEIEKNIAQWDRLETWDEENSPEFFDMVVAAGPAAINPLLDCLENDTRWTRIRRHDGNGDLGELMRVRDLAIIAMERILRFPVLEIPVKWEPVEDSWYGEAAVKMREFCTQYDHACGGELWFRVLKNEREDLDLQWIAAKLIVRPEGVVDLYPQSFYPPDAYERFENPQPSSEGKLLRGRHDPSVLDLLKRAYFRARKHTDEQLASGLPEVTIESFVCAQSQVRRVGANNFLRLVEEWKPGNVDLLKSHYDWLEAGVVKLRKADGYGSWISGFCEEALIRRFWAKDETAMRDYKKFFRAAFKLNEIPLDVMKQLPDEPGMDQLAREAFLGDKAPWSFTKPWTSDSTRKNLIETYREQSPLLEIPAFRQALIEALRDTTKQATLSLTKDGGTLRFDAGKPGEIDSASKGVALLCTDAVGTEIEVRLCDLIAYYLTPKYGSDVWVSPVFHLDDPLPARDHAISEWIHILGR